MYTKAFCINIEHGPSVECDAVKLSVRHEIVVYLQSPVGVPFARHPSKSKAILLFHPPSAHWPDCLNGPIELAIFNRWKRWPNSKGHFYRSTQSRVYFGWCFVIVGTKKPKCRCNEYVDNSCFSICWCMQTHRATEVGSVELIIFIYLFFQNGPSV